MKAMRFLFILLLLSGVCRQALAKEPAVLQAYRARLAGLQRQIPAITQAAEAAAKQQLAHPEMTIRYPWPHQQAFGDEFIARSGALANWDYWPATQATPTPDVFVYAVRSWEEDGEEAKTLLAEAHMRGYTTILIASKKGMPANLPYQFFFDNGARADGQAESPVNMIANITLGWMWQCEFVAALTRHGQYPGVLMSVFLPGADTFDAEMAKHKQQLYPTDARLPKGALAKAYLQRINWMLAQVASARTQAQIAQAADLIAQRVAAGRRVGVASCDHCVPFEVFHAVKTPFTPFHAEGAAAHAFKDHLQPGDLLLWLGYIGVGSKYEDDAKYIREAGLQLIASFTPDTDPANNAPDALARIDQCWKIGDAEVALPFKPDKMAPMSAVNQLLLFRMLDDAVAERMAKAKG